MSVYHVYPRTWAVDAWGLGLKSGSSVRTIRALSTDPSLQPQHTHYVFNVSCGLTFRSPCLYGKCVTYWVISSASCCLFIYSYIKPNCLIQSNFTILFLSYDICKILFCEMISYTQTLGVRLQLYIGALLYTTVERDEHMRRTVRWRLGIPPYVTAASLRTIFLGSLWIWFRQRKTLVSESVITC